VVFEGECAVGWLFAVGGGTSLLRCPVLNMGQASLMLWTPCQCGVAVTLTRDMPSDEAFLQRSCAC